MKKKRVSQTVARWKHRFVRARPALSNQGNEIYRQLGILSRLAPRCLSDPDFLPQPDVQSSLSLPDAISINPPVSLLNSFPLSRYLPRIRLGSFTEEGIGAFRGMRMLGKDENDAIRGAVSEGVGSVCFRLRGLG